MDGYPLLPRKAAAAVVLLESQVPASHPSAPILGQERMGSGVAVAPDRVLTAHHLVIGAATVKVVGSDGRPRRVARVTADHDSGLALLLLDGPELPSARPRDRAVSPGSPVFLLTWTSDLERRGAWGHVLSVGPFEAFWEYMLDRAIMTTALNPGLTGAPLFDQAALLVGIVSLGLAAVGRYTLAIPIELYLGRQDRLARGETSDRRAWMGFYPQNEDGGVVLSGVVPGGPSERAGLARGDLILSVEGTHVSTLRDLYRQLWLRVPGDSLSLQILREAAVLHVEVQAGDRYEFYR